MQKNKYTLKLSEKADHYYNNIQTYTFNVYGGAQLEKYSQMIDKALDAIMSDPNLLGHQREDLPLGYLAYHVGRHIIIYRVNDDIIHVLAILHDRMNFKEQDF